MENVIDKSFGSNCNRDSISRVIKIAMRCVEFNSKDRPLMRIVLHELHGAMDLEHKRRNHAANEVELSARSSVLLPRLARSTV
jgi:hypothetical protein